jgi:hypothetical protein
MQESFNDIGERYSREQEVLSAKPEDWHVLVGRRTTMAPVSKRGSERN